MKSSQLSRGILRAREVRLQPYWDTKSLPTTVAKQTFFSSLPTAAVGTIAQQAATNMQTAGQLPAPRQLLVHGISLAIVDQQAANKVVDAINVLNGLLSFYISDKLYLQLMGWMAPAGGGAFVNGGVTASTETKPYATNGWPVAHNYFHLNPTILIPQQQNFRVEYDQWIAASATTTMQCVLWAREERAVQ